VLLRGVVDSDQEREEALSIARNTDGVEQIDDQLRVGDTSAAQAAQASGADTTSGAVGTSGVDPGTAALYPTDDASVTTGIQAKFFRDSSLKARHIDVATQSGIVTLRGTVANDNERAQARLLAWTTHGVQRVDDVLTVDSTIVGQAQTPLATSPAPQAAPSSAAPAPQAPAPATASQDASLESAVRMRLQGAEGITVTAKDGVVLLDGTVATAAAKQRALTAARQTEGVVQVVDRLRVGK
jgi:osmotically-inducible protein OsmY